MRITTFHLWLLWFIITAIALVSVFLIWLLWLEYMPVWFITYLPKIWGLIIASLGFNILIGIDIDNTNEIVKPKQFFVTTIWKDKKQTTHKYDSVVATANHVKIVSKSPHVVCFDVKYKE